MSPAQPRSRITVVNDSAEFLELMDDILTDAGCEVTTFQADDIGIEAIVASRPDLLVIDLLLEPAKASGWDLVLAARNSASLRGVPIVICSADAEQLRLREAEISAVPELSVLPKPFQLEAAETLIHQLLGRP